MFLGIDYPTWWFLVVGGLFSGYAILDGFDFGAGAWHLFFRKEENRRIALNAIGPVWDGNEVWLVIGGGALFAGFPVMYATFFSSLYIPFMLFLLNIILRAIAIEFRGKEPMLWWRRTWDVIYSISSILLAFLLGVVIGNVLRGIQIGPNYQYQGDGFFEFLNPYALLTGFTTLTLFMVHGANYLLLKTEGRLYAKLQLLLKKGIIAFILSFAITTLYTLIFIEHLTVVFKENPILFIVPVVVFLSVANIPRNVKKKRYLFAFLSSSMVTAFLLMLVFLQQYPVLLPSTLNEAFDLTVHNSASSPKTLKLLLIITAIGAPLSGVYFFLVYKTFRGKVKLDDMSY